jgi:DNA mismatch repair protein MutS
MLAASQIYIDHQYEAAPFCFVDFIVSDVPRIQSKNFWNMLIDQNKVVLNDLAIGKNIILTGCNAGGKSTTLKAFLQNLLLAQTFGIAAASEFAMTPFAKVSSYLNITDDLTQGKSLFKAEVARAKELLNATNSLEGNQFGFCAIDELFTGTTAEAGEECAYNLVSKLGSNRNSLFVFATHYHSLTELESDTSSFANYMVGAPTKINGTLVYPFTLQAGINTVNIANDILLEEQVL